MLTRILPRAWCALALTLFGVSSLARGDLAGEFAGYSYVQEVGVSGLVSSYHQPTGNGNTLPDYLPSLGPGRVSYPHGIGQVPSPGGAVSQYFDQAALGAKMDGSNLVIQAAGGMDPTTGYYYQGRRFGQGDVFLTVQDAAGVRQYALLTSWASDPLGPLPLNGSQYNQALSFHTAGGPDGGSIEGYLVRLESPDDVLVVSGTLAYYHGYRYPVVGLDYRVYAQDGVVIGDTSLAHSTVADGGQTWHLESWTVPTDWLDLSGDFSLALHRTLSCGNDQIGIVVDLTGPPVVPAPGAAVLGLIGLGSVFAARRRSARPQKKAE